MSVATLDSSASKSEPVDYLAALNPEQRAAVEHGDGTVAAPLLVIAGAGSGKTNTLAHRVAHLIVSGADPRRIKGQEWTKVFVLNAVDGCIPSDLAVGEREEIEEERRLLYVAMTRAKDSLHLITPQRFFVHGQAARGDRHVYASRTRFISESMLGQFERISWPPPSTAKGRAPQPEVRVDLKSKMRGMWR